jgi:hypothetical protein
MECRPAAFLALLTLFAAGEAGGQPPAAAPAGIKAESLRLIQADLERLPPPGTAPPLSPAPGPGVIRLGPFIVNGRVAPDLPPPRYVTPFQRFLQDGTIYRKGPFSIQAALVPAPRALGSANKPGPRFELSLSWLF